VAALGIGGLSVSFGHTHVLAFISLHMARDRFVLILCPFGAGTPTLLRVFKRKLVSED
jgi:ABC-type polar amino acid transport system ATPase subunit